ncbi:MULTISPECIES: MauE/DoxX family redox-associated membrane protein [Microbacterium]|uniref:MauE/DoxX family redox-associated membrane protein n=1 Tax=Microbacterium TaxID=33882 RepID=UPI00217E6D37|nr:MULTISPECIES: MauE/DoxX family redox-associated membrane protein [Microbacterium]UWF77902.1 hypothetical protein JSY13_02230 [Microbacterium neungamense]WCM56079.1 hypothetical protein JRG78_02275 [Microbacterium sp. EF45047]
MREVLMAAPLILAGVLLAAAIAKLRTPDTLAGWAELGVPDFLRREWLRRLHPVGEILLAALLLGTGAWLGVLAAAAAVLLFVAYLVLVVRSFRQSPGASCSCFGSRRPITAVTVVRNAWFLLLALAALGVVGAAPLLGGAVVALGASWVWMPALAAAALTVWLSVGEPATAGVGAGVPIMPTSADAGVRTDADDPADYIRTRTPAVPVTLADGRTVNLRDLAARGPLLLLAVSETCGSCVPAIEAMPRWRALLPEVSVRFLLTHDPAVSRLADTTEPQTLHDRPGYVRSSIADWATPAAVLVGADGYLAGGPVSGYDEIEAFIGDIYEILHGARPPQSPAGA